MVIDIGSIALEVGTSNKYGGDGFNKVTRR